MENADELINEKEQLVEVQSEMDETVTVTLPRPSERPSIPTEKMLLYQKDELTKRERKLLSIYEQWKGQVRVYREDLKGDLSDSKSADMADDIEKTVNDMNDKSIQ